MGKRRGQRYVIKTTNGQRQMSAAEIAQYKKQLTKKAEFERAKEQVTQNLKALKGKKYTGISGSGPAKFGITAEIETLVDGRLRIKRPDAVQVPVLIKKTIKPDLYGLLISCVIDSINDMLADATAARREATKPLTDMIEGLKDLQEAQQVSSEEEEAQAS